MYVDDWAGYIDPGQTLTAETTSQIGTTNEPCWSNAAYDKLDVEQAAALDPTQRQNLIWQMQQIMYQQTPWVVLVYPEYLEAYNTSRWTGWTPDAQRARSGLHGDRRRAAGVDSYLNLRPAVDKATGGGSKAAIVAIVIAIVVVLAGVSVWLVRRGRVRVEEA